MSRWAIRRGGVLKGILDGFLQVTGGRRADLEAGGVDEADQQRLAAVTRQFDRPALAIEEDEVSDRFADCALREAKAAFSSRAVSARPLLTPCGRAVSLGWSVAASSARSGLPASRKTSDASSARENRPITALGRLENQKPNCGRRWLPSSTSVNWISEA
jgi:hypothetical protein